MSDSNWWGHLQVGELLELRRRVLKQLAPQFQDKLGGELEDVVQQAFVVLFRRRSSVDPQQDGLFRYLLTVARNAALDRIRTSQRHKERLHHVAASSGDTILTHSAVSPSGPGYEEEVEKLWRIFCALAPLDRLILWSYAVEDRSVRQIARDLDQNWHRVAKTLDGVLRRIRRDLEG